MRNSIRILLLLISVGIIGGIAYMWASYSPVVAEYRWLTHARDSETGLAGSFATALSLNHPAAYDWIDPSLKHRLDEWMNTHQSKECTHEPDWFLIGPDPKGPYDVRFGCYGTNGWITFEVDRIVIKNMIVVDWGEVREGD
jgi:hypothetical protein